MAYSMAVDIGSLNRQNDFRDLTMKFISVQKKVSSRNRTAAIPMLSLLNIKLDLFFVERKLSRMMDATYKIVSKNPSTEKKIVDLIVDQLARTIRGTNDIMKQLKNLPIDTSKHYYVKKSLNTYDAICELFDDYSDMADEDLMSRINNPNTEYISEDEFWKKMNVHA